MQVEATFWGDRALTFATGGSLAVALPFAFNAIRAVWDGRMARADRERRGDETAADRVARREQEQYARLVAEIARLDRELAEERARSGQIEDDRDEGWDLARGWEDAAHALRHERNGIAQNHNALLSLCNEAAGGRMSPGCLAQRVEGVAAVPRRAELPRLQDGQRIKP